MENNRNTKIGSLVHKNESVLSADHDWPFMISTPSVMPVFNIGKSVGNLLFIIGRKWGDNITVTVHDSILHT